MTPVEKFLSFKIDGNPLAETIVLGPNECRHALVDLELSNILQHALRNMIEHPKNPESLAYAQRVLERIDTYKAKHPTDAVLDVAHRAANPPIIEPAVSNSADDLL